MQDFFYTNPTYNFKKGTPNKLSVLVQNQGLTYIIQEDTTDKLLALRYKKNIDSEDFESSLRYFLESCLELQSSFVKQTIVYATPKVTIIPSALYDKHTLQLFFSANYALESYEEVKSHKLHQSESVMVYSIPQVLQKQCEHALGSGLHFMPEAAPFIEMSSMHNKLSHDKTVYVNVQHSYIHVLVLQGQKIILLNSYNYTNNNDYVYYIMNVYEQLQLHPLEQKLYLSGLISEESRYFDSVKMFIKHVSIMPIPHYHSEFLHHPFHAHYYSLFSTISHVSLCE